MKHATKAWNVTLAMVLCGALLPVTALCAQPSEGGNAPRFFVVKPQAACYVPTASETREVFGDAWQLAGVTVDVVEMQFCPKHEVALQFDPMLRESGDNHAYLVPLGVQYTGYFTETGKVRPYWTAGADAMFIDLEVPEQQINDNTVAFAGSLGVGAKFANDGFVELSYQTTKHVEDFDLCGAKLTAGIAF